MVEVEVQSTRAGDAEVAGSVSLGGAEVAESEKRCGGVGSERVYGRRGCSK